VINKLEIREDAMESVCIKYLLGLVIGFLDYFLDYYLNMF
jgi:hypothetical protein